MAVGFVAQVGNAFQLLVVDQLRHTLDQTRLVHLIRQLGDDDPGPAGLFVLFDLGPGAHLQHAAAVVIRLANRGAAVDEARCRKVRSGMISINSEIVISGLSDQRDQPVDNLTQIVGWNVGRHTDRDCRRKPLTRRFGIRAGSTTGSWIVSS